MGQERTALLEVLALLEGTPRTFTAMDKAIYQAKRLAVGALNKGEDDASRLCGIGQDGAGDVSGDGAPCP